MIDLVRVVEVIRLTGVVRVVEAVRGVRKLNVPRTRTTTRKKFNPLQDHAASGW